MSAISLEFVMEMLLVMTFKGAMGAPAIVAILEMDFPAKVRSLF